MLIESGCWFFFQQGGYSKQHWCSISGHSFSPVPESAMGHTVPVCILSALLPCCSHSYVTNWEKLFKWFGFFHKGNNLFLSWNPAQQCLILVLRRKQCQWSLKNIRTSIFSVSQETHFPAENKRTKPDLLVACTCLSPCCFSAQNFLLLYACVLGIIFRGPLKFPLSGVLNNTFLLGVSGTFLIRWDL